ncbi:hypothetical protein cyc_00103 [Cyclospora cayetanensis]|uniref:Uncharacterized protein n=1 Tax=Cyclospora cayetanensis TaxID=88456 RepID=A0A1D3CYD0_9EIME|nr:hypothetical protein cyc_00103 [Cyclospora cayetanensis]
MEQTRDPVALDRWEKGHRRSQGLQRGPHRMYREQESESMTGFLSGLKKNLQESLTSPGSLEAEWQSRVPRMEGGDPRQAAHDYWKWQLEQNEKQWQKQERRRQLHQQEWTDHPSGPSFEQNEWQRSLRRKGYKPTSKPQWTCLEQFRKTLSIDSGEEEDTGRENESENRESAPTPRYPDDVQRSPRRRPPEADPEEAFTQRQKTERHFAEARYADTHGGHPPRASHERRSSRKLRWRGDSPVWATEEASRSPGRDLRGFPQDAETGRTAAGCRYDHISPLASPRFGSLESPESDAEGAPPSGVESRQSPVFGGRRPYSSSSAKPSSQPSSRHAQDAADYGEPWMDSSPTVGARQSEEEAVAPLGDALEYEAAIPRRQRLLQMASSAPPLHAQLSRRQAVAQDAQLRSAVRQQLDEGLREALTLDLLEFQREAFFGKQKGRHRSGEAPLPLRVLEEGVEWKEDGVESHQTAAAADKTPSSPSSSSSLSPESRDAQAAAEEGSAAGEESAEAAEDGPQDRETAAFAEAGGGEEEGEAAPEDYPKGTLHTEEALGDPSEQHASESFLDCRPPTTQHLSQEEQFEGDAAFQETEVQDGGDGEEEGVAAEAEESMQEEGAARAAEFFSQKAEDCEPPAETCGRPLQHSAMADQQLTVEALRAVSLGMVQPLQQSGDGSATGNFLSEWLQQCAQLRQQAFRQGDRSAVGECMQQVPEASGSGSVASVSSSVPSDFQWWTPQADDTASPEAPQEEDATQQQQSSPLPSLEQTASPSDTPEAAGRQSLPRGEEAAGVDVMRLLNGPSAPEKARGKSAFSRGTACADHAAASGEALFAGATPPPPGAHAEKAAHALLPAGAALCGVAGTAAGAAAASPSACESPSMQQKLHLENARGSIRGSLLEERDLENLKQLQRLRAERANAAANGRGRFAGCASTSLAAKDGEQRGESACGASFACSTLGKRVLPAPPPSRGRSLRAAAEDVGFFSGALDGGGGENLQLPTGVASGVVAESSKLSGENKQPGEVALEPALQKAETTQPQFALAKSSELEAMQREEEASEEMRGQRKKEYFSLVSQQQSEQLHQKRRSQQSSPRVRFAEDALQNEQLKEQLKRQSRELKKLRHFKSVQHALHKETERHLDVLHMELNKLAAENVELIEQRQKTGIAAQHVAFRLLVLHARASRKAVMEDAAVSPRKDEEEALNHVVQQNRELQQMQWQLQQLRQKVIATHTKQQEGQQRLRELQAKAATLQQENTALKQTRISSDVAAEQKARMEAEEQLRETLEVLELLKECLQEQKEKASSLEEQLADAQRQHSELKQQLEQQALEKRPVTTSAAVLLDALASSAGYVPCLVNALAPYAFPAAAAALLPRVAEKNSSEQQPQGEAHAHAGKRQSGSWGEDTAGEDAGSSSSEDWLKLLADAIQDEEQARQNTADSDTTQPAKMQCSTAEGQHPKEQTLARVPESGEAPGDVLLQRQQHTFRFSLPRKTDAAARAASNAPSLLSAAPSVQPAATLQEQETRQRLLQQLRESLEERVCKHLEKLQVSLSVESQTAGGSSKSLDVPGIQEGVLSSRQESSRQGEGGSSPRGRAAGACLKSGGFGMQKRGLSPPVADQQAEQKTSSERENPWLQAQQPPSPSRISSQSFMSSGGSTVESVQLQDFTAGLAEKDASGISRRQEISRSPVVSTTASSVFGGDTAGCSAFPVSVGKAELADIELSDDVPAARQKIQEFRRQLRQQGLLS